MKCNVQLEGEPGSNYNSPSFLLQGGIFFSFPLQYIGIFYLFTAQTQSIRMPVFINLISHCTLLCCAVLLYNKAESKECLTRLQELFVPA